MEESLYDQLERQHRERKKWIDEDRAIMKAANDKHSAWTNKTLAAILFRPVVELAILIVLIIEFF